MADISISFFSTMMARHVTVKVIIPFDIADLLGYKQPFPTLYFLPGYSANAESIVSSTILAERAAAKGFAVVIPDGENSFYVDQPDINTFYERFVVEELVSVTRKLLPISDKQEDTYIGGISMGGYGCMMLASRHPETFSKVLALSPATKAFGPKMLENGFTQALLEHYFKSEENYMQNYDPLTNFRQAKADGKKLPDIYLCCGEQDPLVYEMDVDFVKQMEQEGISITSQWGDGVHDSWYWNKVLPDAIDFMLKNKIIWQPRRYAGAVATIRRRNLYG